MLTEAEVQDIPDDQLKQLAVILDELGITSWRNEVIYVVRARRALWLTFEAELMNADIEEGYLVGPDDDPIADALAEFRRDRQ